MKNHNRKQNILILITVVLLMVAVFQSAFVDGIGITLTVLFPYSLLILIGTTISLIWGYKKRKERPRWYMHGLIILSLGVLVFWTPVLKHARNFIDLNWRWNSRNKVVEDIKSGKLKPYDAIPKHKSGEVESYYVVVPFETYGRVSFAEVQGNDNAVSVITMPLTGAMVTFTTNGGFLFGSIAQLIYIEKPQGKNNSRFFKTVNKNWYRHETSGSLLTIGKHRKP